MNNQKTFLVSFLVLAAVLFVTSIASATSIANFTSIKVNNVETIGNNNSVAILGGTSVPITVTFIANADESNVRLNADFQGITSDTQNEILVGDIEAGHTYIETINLDVPSDIGDVQSGNINLLLTLWNGDSSISQTTQTVQLREQRQTYNVQIMSLNTVDTVNAGDLFPVDVVLQNVGYNNLSDMYVIASIPALGISKTAFFGDIQTAGGNDTATGRIFLQMPFNAAPGTYTLQVEVKNSNLDLTTTTNVPVANDFQSNVIASNSSLTANIGQDAQYSLMIVNPTSNIKLYQIVPSTVSGVTITGDSVVTVPAGSSKEVAITANAASSGNYNFTVSVLSGGQLTGTTYLLLNAQNGISSPIVILTIILAILFLVLLAVLIVLVTRKPNKQKEEFSESYY